MNGVLAGEITTADDFDGTVGIGFAGRPDMGANAWQALDQGG